MIKISNQSFVPSWPEERDLECYEDFFAVSFAQFLKTKKDTWIDIGCRTGLALIESKKNFSANLIGVNAHPAKVRKGFTHLWSSIPEDPYLHNHYKRSAKLVTDLYGAVSYCCNPLEALIYEATLLGPKSRLYCYLLEERLSSRQTWKDITRFFKSTTKQKVVFTPLAGQTNSGRPLKCLRISIAGKCQTKLEIDQLFLRAQSMVGIPKKEEIIFQAADKSAAQWKVVFIK